VKRPHNFTLSFYWFAWELHWAALLGATLQADIARFMPETYYGRASAILGGFGAFVAILTQYGAGRASDLARSRAPFIIVGTLLDVVALFVFAQAPSFGAAVLGFASVNIALNIAGGPYQALIPDRVDKGAQGKASAYMGFMRLAGTVVGLLLAKVFVHQPGPGVTAAMLERGLTGLVAAISLVLLAALAVTIFGVKERPGDVPAPEPVLAHWESRTSFWWLIVQRSFVSCGLYSILPFLGFYLRFALHISGFLSASLTLLLVMVVCSLAGTVPAGVIGDRMSKKSIIFIALGMVALGALALAFLTSLTPVYAVAVIIGIGWGAYYSVDWALATNLLPSGRAGALMAIWNLGTSAPQVAAPIIGGLLVDKLGEATGNFGLAYRTLFVLVATFVALGAIALSFVREPRREPKKE